MKIAEIAPPWVKVPPERYGGIEWIVSLLTEELVNRGHSVTLSMSLSTLVARTYMVLYTQWQHRVLLLFWMRIATT